MRKYNTISHKKEIRRKFSGRIRTTALIPVTENVQLIIGYVWGNYNRKNMSFRFV